MRLKSEVDEPVRLHVDVRSEGPVTAGDLICPPEVEIVNPELLLLTADSAGGRSGHRVDGQPRPRLLARPRSAGKLPLGEIPVDAIYSPVRKVNYTVERARIGQQTNYDRLNLEIWTDGTMTPEDALRESAKLLVRHLSLIAGAGRVAGGGRRREAAGFPAASTTCRSRSWSCPCGPTTA